MALGHICISDGGAERDASDISVRKAELDGRRGVFWHESGCGHDDSSHILCRRRLFCGIVVVQFVKGAEETKLH